MDDIAALRKELKTWERNFKATHGREPSIKDVGNQPGLADKYKKYRKSLKESKSKPANPPSTPPRSQPRASTHLLSQPRPIAASQPLSGYNPFSPQKNKGKQKELSPDAFSSKLKPFRITRDPSPSPIPRIPAPDPFLATPDDAVSRARKRLRGEPVSPSPKKEKRRRIAQDSEDDEDGNPDVNDASFVEDSPIKQPTGFKLLFDEAPPPSKLIFPTLKNTAGLFREKTVDKMDVDEEKPPALGVRSKEEANNAPSDDEMGDPRPPKSASNSRDLLAPSPPPATQRVPTKSRFANGKGKAKANGGVNAPKQSRTSDSEDGSRSDDEMNVRVIDRHAFRGRAARADDSDMDEEAYYLGSRRRHPDADVIQQESTIGSETISVPDTLLNILSLAPATTTRGRRDEEVVGQLLYGERRGNYDPSKGGEIWGVGEYEGQERDEFALASTNGSKHPTYDDEDDWEGEGVPWEVGEL